MNNLDTYKVAIFDCDGVILDSNKIKSEAFSLALSDENPALVKEFVEYHQKNGGISRYIKFEHFFKKIKKQSNYSQALNAALARYATLSKKGLLECSEIAGIRDVLEYLNVLKIPCYVASGGDQLEVREVFETRGLTSYFDEIFGSPLSKIENIASLKAEGKLAIPGVFFGDARNDLNAAQEYGLDFIFISGVSEWKDGSLVCNEMNLPSYIDFRSLLRV
jgi:phosphoglycolate phosphatase-like HAD superfamily hydrolase